MNIEQAERGISTCKAILIRLRAQIAAAAPQAAGPTPRVGCDGGWIGVSAKQNPREILSAKAQLESLSNCEAEAEWFLNEYTQRVSRKTLGDQIDRYRLLCGWTVEDLAEQIDMSRDAVSDHINKGATPQPAKLAKYAEVFSGSGKVGRVTIKDLTG